MRTDYIDEQQTEIESEQTPSLSELLRLALENKIADINVSMPAKVIEYNPDKQIARVKPCLKRKYIDGEIQTLPDIYNVPVLQFRTAKSIIHLPVKKDDYVTLVFCDRSLDLWKVNGGEIYPEDIRTHHITDAYALPAGYPFKDAIEIEDSDDIYIKNENTRLFLKPNGHVQLKNKQNELIKVLYDFVKHVLEARTYTGIGQQLLNHLEFDNDLKKLKSFLEND